MLQHCRMCVGWTRSEGVGGTWLFAVGRRATKAAMVGVALCRCRCPQLLGNFATVAEVAEFLDPEVCCWLEGGAALLFGLHG